MMGRSAARGLWRVLGAGGAILSLLAACDLQLPWHRPRGVVIDPEKAWIDAKSALLQAVDDESPLTRTNAIEALGETLGQEAGAVFLEGLGDAHPTVRFASAMVVGDLRYAPGKDRLARMAQDKQAEPDRRVLCGVLYALHRLGDDRFTGELGRLLFDAEAEVRANAAMAMGKTGAPSAIGPLKTLLGDELNPKVRWQIRESLALLGDMPSMLRLEGFARQPDPALRLLAISALGRIRSDTAVPALRKLLSKRNPPRVRVSAAGMLARLCEVDPSGFELCLASVRDPAAVLRKHGGRAGTAPPAQCSSLRQLAARSLGWMGRTEALDALHAVLSSQAGSARVAAAMGILRLSAPPGPRRGAATQGDPGAPRRGPPNADAPKLHGAGGKDCRS